MPAAARQATARAPAAATPMAFARAIVAAYARHGQDPQAALRAAQITPAQLRAPAGRMTARQMELLSATAMQALDDEGLAAFSRRLPWGSYGLLARASLTAPDLRTALKRWCRHHGLLVDDLALTLGEPGGVACLTVAERAPLPAAVRELSLTFLLRNVHGLACWYVDSRIPLLAAQLPFAAPPHAAAYGVMFPGARLRFDPAPGATAELRFDARYLALPLRRDEAAMRQMLQRALPLTVLQYRRDRLLVPQVRQLLREEPEAARNAQQLAERLHVSVRTLHRQLKQEGASLQGLKDEVRLQLASELLHRSRDPIKQLAGRVGFRNEKSFARAFRKWAGVSPEQHRRAADAS